MEHQGQKQDYAHIEADVEYRTEQALRHLASVFHISTGEAIDQLVKYYAPCGDGFQKERILTELSGILDADSYL